MRPIDVEGATPAEAEECTRFAVAAIESRTDIRLADYGQSWEHVPHRLRTVAANIAAYRHAQGARADDGLPLSILVDLCEWALEQEQDL